MAFKCSICEIDIQVGEPMLADERMNLAHQTCVEKRRDSDPPTTVHLPSVQVSPAPLVSVKTKVGGPGFGNPTAAIEPCLIPPERPVCAECAKPAISMCPACLAYVHQSFGYNGPACSMNHEQKCPGARQSRDLVRELPKKVSRALISMAAPVADAALRVYESKLKRKPKPKKNQKKSQKKRSRR